MGDEGWVAILEGLAEGGCTELQYLCTSIDEASGTVAEALVHALSSGHCHRLEKLYACDSFEDDDSIRLVLRSVKKLSFPSIREFTIGDIKYDEDHSILLAEALKAGAFPKLEVLQFSDQSIHHSLWEVLEAGSCPEMRNIGMCRALLDSDSSTALASALASGWLSKLQEFQFADRLDDGGDDDTSLLEVLMALA